jgi:hypothetical protein
MHGFSPYISISYPIDPFIRSDYKTPALAVVLQSMLPSGKYLSVFSISATIVGFMIIYCTIGGTQMIEFDKEVSRWQSLSDSILATIA